MVVLLGQARNRDGTDGPSADGSGTQRERAPVGRKTVEVEGREDSSKVVPRARKRAPTRNELAPYTLHDSSLTINPRVVVGARPRKCAMEELLRCGTDIDRNWGSSLTGHFDQERPEAPSVIVGEALQDQARFLFLQDRYEFFRALRGHGLRKLPATG